MLEISNAIPAVFNSLHKYIFILGIFRSNVFHVWCNITQVVKYLQKVKYSTFKKKCWVENLIFKTLKSFKIC